MIIEYEDLWNVDLFSGEGAINAAFGQDLGFQWLTDSKKEMISSE